MKHRIHATRHTREGRRRRGRTAYRLQPARPGQPPSTPDRCHLRREVHITPRGYHPARGGVLSSAARVSSSRCMQVLTTAPRGGVLSSEQPLHASAHYGAPITELARHLHASAHHGARRPLRTCALCRARRAPRAAGTGVAASPRRDHTCREHLMRGNQMQSDAIRCNQMQSDALRGTQRQSRSHVPRAPDERQSEAIRSHQRQSEAIRSHQRQSEAIQSAPLMFSDRTEP